jgi:hypothetical protein
VELPVRDTPGKGTPAREPSARGTSAKEINTPKKPTKEEIAEIER